MSLAALELCFRASAVAMLLVLAVTLLAGFRHVLAGRLAVAFALGSAAHAASYAIGGSAAVSAWHAPLIALSTGNAVVFWLFTRALFDDAFGLRWWHALLWAVVAALSSVSCLWGPPGEVRVSAIATNLAALGFIVLAILQTVASWSGDLVEGRRRLRVFIVASAALYGGLNALLQIFVAGGEVSELANPVSAGGLACIVAALSCAMMRVDGADLFPAEAEPSPAIAPDRTGSIDESADRKLAEALMRLMADERIYRHDNMTIGALAARLKVPEYRLRRLINQRLGYRNFNAFLNNHRIEEAKAALADPSQAAVPVITIAMDAGFQSLGPFNRAFKAVTGMTPTEYRRLKASTV